MRACVRARARVCVCVCVRERERERDRDRDRDRDRETDRQTDRDREMTFFSLFLNYRPFACWTKLTPSCFGLIDVRLYSAILRSLEQTHCARIWFYMSD